MYWPMALTRGESEVYMPLGRTPLGSETKRRFRDRLIAALQPWSGGRPLEQAKQLTSSDTSCHPTLMS